MPTPSYSELDTRAKLINPALYARGWTEDHIRREVNAGGLVLVRGDWKREQKLVDYLLSLRVEGHPEMVPVAIIEAKRNTFPPHYGLEQAKQYADARRLNVPFVYSSNGYQYVEFDRATGATSAPHAMPDELRRRYEEQMGFRLDDEIARPLLTPYKGGDSSRRYYQDAAIRALLEAIAQGKNRLLLSLATGAGKTRIAALLLRRIADAGQLNRVLFVCDRTELRDQATLTFQNWFGNDAQPVSTYNDCKNARILIATYQTLDVDTDDANANFFLTHYPRNYFSHIVIDECHRSAWGKWSIVLTHNPGAIQVGLTATPRQIKGGEHAPDDTDEWLTADNLRYFGEPVYQYDMGQAIRDGYLAACEILKSGINLDDTGITVDQIIARHPRDPITGDPVPEHEIRELYEKTSYERRLILPDRVEAMTQDLFGHLLATGGPEQKTIIFCVGDDHADHVASRMNNLYNAWCAEHGRSPKDHYAFKCTAASSGNDMLPDFRGSANSYYIDTLYSR
jgi:type I restriction enzyme R subunit